MTCVLMAAACVGAGQTISTELNRDSVLVGERVYMAVRICTDISTDSLTVLWPEWPEFLGESIYLVQADTSRTYLPDPVNAPYAFCQEQVLIVAPMDTGFVAIPPLEIPTTVGTFQTKPLLVHAAGPAIDHTGTFKDIDPPHAVDYTIRDWIADQWLVVLIGLGIAIAVFWLVRRYLNQPIQPVEVDNAPTPEVVAPHVLALEQLEALRDEQLWQRGEVKRYHIRLNNIFREYLENRYHIQALEETSDEILTTFQMRGMPPAIYERVTGAMRMADLVKFAKAKPGDSDNEEAFAAVQQFVERTQSTPTP